MEILIWTWLKVTGSLLGNLDSFLQVPRVATSEDIFDCQNWGWSAISIQWLETGDAGILLTILQCTGQSTTKNYEAPNVNSVDSEDLPPILTHVLAVASWCQTPLFYLQRNFPIYGCDCQNLAPSTEIFVMTEPIRFVPSNALCKMSAPRYPKGYFYSYFGSVTFSIFSLALCLQSAASVVHPCQV